MVDFTVRFFNNNNITGYDNELAYKQLKTKFICMTKSTGGLRRQYFEMYPEANRYKYLFLKEWRKEVGIYQLIACYLALCGNMYLFDLMLKFRKYIRRK